MSRTVPLVAYITGVVASSTATVQTGPRFQGEIWYPESVSISCTGTQPTPAAPNIATCNIYTGLSANNVSFLDGTYQVLGASSSMISGIILYPGQLVLAVWSNMTGSNGQTVTMTVNGSKQIP